MMETAANTGSGSGQDIKAEFARRKKSRNYATFGLAALLVAMVLMEIANMSRTVAMAIVILLIALMLADFAYIFRVWRCPACERFLGAQSTAFGPAQRLDSCPKCKAELV
jgi:hypothetical protein